MTFPQKPALRGAAGANRIALICADWHADCVAQSRAAAMDELHRAGPAELVVEAFELPSADEIPLLAKKLACSGRYQALIAFGRIGTPDGVGEPDSGWLIDRLMRVQLATTVPVFSAVLAPREFQEHTIHRRFFSDHFVRKGQDVAQACLEVLDAARDMARHRAPACGAPQRGSLPA